MTHPTGDLSFIRPATGERIAVGPRVHGVTFQTNSIRLGHEMGDCPNHLWHETATPAQYAEFGLKLGRNFPPSAFEGFFSQAGS